MKNIGIKEITLLMVFQISKIEFKTKQEEAKKVGWGSRKRKEEKCQEIQ